MAFSAAPRRAEHLGSLLRPTELIEALNNNVDAETRQEIEDRGINTIVNDQVYLGFKVINDGEYRRHLFWGSFFESLVGFEKVNLTESTVRKYLPKVKALLEYKTDTTLFCSGKIRHSGSSPHLREFLYLKSILPPNQIGNIKITIPAPHWYHLQYQEGQAYSKDIYASDDAYFKDLAAAYQEELRILYDAGLRRVQIDDPDLSYFCSKDVLDAWGLDQTNSKSTLELLTTYVNLYNDCFREVKPDMHIGIHVCRGNFTDSRYWSTGGYDMIAGQIFRDMNVNTYYLEFDTHRAGGFEPLQFLPADKHVVLGVVSTKSSQLEDLAELKERVMHAARFISKGNHITLEESLQRIGVSPQCGFASHSRENRLTKHVMLEKLALVKQLAESIWPGQD
ncbi:hypothetical protein N7456_010725 [Penicillium angulare]|uniref:Cobalamin-independent methionine synthase MetE C-terminal/archaeal domain-containing protein n=1 Tax=Penicillium angulare TaxID=116970 RepID=A0A9W9F7D8_9EURO|nr:hypothetical protein N7456_010725 [Penicillium angulare]